MRIFQLAIFESRARISKINIGINTLSIWRQIKYLSVTNDVVRNNHHILLSIAVEISSVCRNDEIFITVTLKFLKYGIEKVEYTFGHNIYGGCRN